jgi:hypothetical protein
LVASYQACAASESMIETKVRTERRSVRQSPFCSGQSKEIIEKFLQTTCMPCLLPDWRIYFQFKQFLFYNIVNQNCISTTKTHMKHPSDDPPEKTSEVPPAMAIAAGTGWCDGVSSSSTLGFAKPESSEELRVCENCRKEFLSWKSFLEHGKCSSEEAKSLISLPSSNGDDGRRGSG